MLRTSEGTDLVDAAMRRYAAGDDKAFDQLYTLLRPRVQRMCEQLGGGADADELVQDVFLKMHRARASFVSHGGATAWAYAIARTTLIDRVRRCARRPECITSPELLETCPAPASSDPEAALHSRRLERIVHLRIGQLSPNLRAAFVLVKCEEVSCEAAAFRLGTSTSAIKQRVHRANEELKLAVLRSGGVELS